MEKPEEDEFEKGGDMGEGEQRRGEEMVNDEDEEDPDDFFKTNNHIGPDGNYPPGFDPRDLD